MLSQNDDGRITVKEYFRVFITDCRENDLYEASTIDAYENKLLGDTAVLSGVEALRLARAVYLDQVNRSVIRQAKRLIRKAYPKPAQAGAVESALNTALKHGMDNGLFGKPTLREKDLYELKQKRKNPPKAEQLSPEEAAALSKAPLGEPGFEHWRNQAIFVNCMLVHGFRAGTEIWRQNEGDYNRQALEMTITRERGHRQTVVLRKADRIALDRWLLEKRKRIEEMRVRGIVAADEDALFISDKPRMRNGKLTWRMDTPQLIAEFDKIRTQLGFPSEIKGGWLRHNSCTSLQQIAMALGYHEGYISTIEDHSVLTERLYYAVIIGPEIEILARTQQEAIELLERIAAHAVVRFLTHPLQLRHFSVIVFAILTMGRLQMRAMLSDYRDDLLDLDNMPRNPFMCPIRNVADMVRLISQKTILCLCPWISH